ncbi:helix-turn-helix transcriptional regulator [Amycolatopsis sp.]|uniref:helix-turn-helix transcriptional regulator n=1 Tax=Amycolatopsis sp. TaxID=37632 RepID=UPI002D7EF890|nr:AAA family ATPase [Amycolatopsis sp.]HET6705436.1 AAA family ATPase [Amycolatopsis sp.]
MPERAGKRASGEFVGRDVELRVLDGCVETAGLVLVRAGAGAGKTALLREFRKRARSRGAHVIAFGCGDVPEWDDFGTVPVIAAVRAELPKIGDPRVAAAVAAVVRGSTPETYSSAPARAALFADLVRFFFALRGDGAVVVLVDDVHTAPRPEAVIGAAYQAGCAVVAACRTEAGGGPARLSAMARRILDLPPLPAERLLEALAGGRLDDAVAPAVFTALGSLAGNAGTLSAVFGELVRDGRFADVLGHRCLADPDRPIALPSGHPLVRHVTEFGALGAELVALAHRSDLFGVDDLPAFAAATGRDLDTCGRAVDDLVVAGALDHDEEGRLSVPCPALVPAVVRACPVDLPAVHRAIAEHLLRAGPLGVEPAEPVPAGAAVVAGAAGHTAPAESAAAAGHVAPAELAGVAEHVAPAEPAAIAERAASAGVAGHTAPAEPAATAEHVAPAAPAIVAEHVALAGPALPPDPALVALLEQEAARVGRHDPVTAARCHRAALRHCEPGSATHSRVLGAALRLLIRTGDYRCLGDVVAEAVAGGFAEGVRYELAVSAALVAVHLGGPVPEPVRGALAVGASGRAPLDFAAAFGAGSYAFEGEAAFGAFRGEPVGADWARGLEQAGDQHDILSLIRLLVGPGYGEPKSGPMAVFGRLTRNFTRGEWAGIPSDARRLELTGGIPAPLRQFTRVIAAEIHASWGKPERAAQWLAKVSADFPFRAIRTWAEIGIAYRAGDWDRARERGWAAYPDVVGDPVHPGDLVGLRWFLVRMGYLEKQAGNVEKLQVLCRDAKRLHARHPGVTLRIAELILRGLAENDRAAAAEAVDILRRHGNRPDLMRALITVAFLAEDPRPWYHEAYEIAEQLGGEWLRTSVTASMKESGVAAPSRRSGMVALTGDEERIIGLIQQGLTNRQIAAAVRVSEKTVESHLTKLFAKTGCRSRLDLATASLDGRLVFTPVP